MSHWRADPACVLCKGSSRLPRNNYACPCTFRERGEKVPNQPEQKEETWDLSRVPETVLEDALRAAQRKRRDAFQASLDHMTFEEVRTACAQKGWKLEEMPKGVRG